MRATPAHGDRIRHAVRTFDLIDQQTELANADAGNRDQPEDRLQARPSQLASVRHAVFGQQGQPRQPGLHRQFDERDVVRHNLVQRIVKAYERNQEQALGRQLSLRLNEPVIQSSFSEEKADAVAPVAADAAAQ